jgi:1,4-dihydroxy-2-naphthoate octaprenyltransferase
MKKLQALTVAAAMLVGTANLMMANDHKDKKDDHKEEKHDEHKKKG